MTSRRDLPGKLSMEELDSLIRWALQERVRGDSPPPWMCERICALAERSTGRRLMRYRISRCYWAVVERLSSVDAFLSALIAPRMRPQSGWVEWRFDPRFTCLLDQFGFLMQLAF